MKRFSKSSKLLSVLLAATLVLAGCNNDSGTQRRLLKVATKKLNNLPKKRKNLLRTKKNLKEKKLVNKEFLK